MSKIVILDTETTGLKDPEANEIGYIVIKDLHSLEVIGTFEKRYKPSKPSEYGALMTHHILESELVDCPPPSEFKLPEGTEYIIGHNIDYDAKVLGLMGSPVKRICTKALSTFLVPGIDSHRQSAMIYYFEGGKARDMLQQAHSALPDVLNCLVLLKHLLTFNDVPREIEDLYKYSEKARVPTRMPFGKHKGELIRDVPYGYKSWLLNQPDIDTYLVKALRTLK